MNEYLVATWESIYMVLGSSLIAALLGLPLAVLLILSQKEGLRPRPRLFAVLDVIINSLRSFPFIILMIIVMPLSALLVGRKTGTTAMIVPLSIAAAPFVARMMEQSMNELGRGKIEAALSMGATATQIVQRVYLREAAPALVSSMTITVINIIGYSAMAGTLGGGGLGDLAVRYGLYNSQPEKLFIGCIIIILLVQLVQFVGKRITKAIDHR